MEKLSQVPKAEKTMVTRQNVIYELCNKIYCSFRPVYFGRSAWADTLTVRL